MRLCSCVNPDENRCTLIRNAATPSLGWDLVYDISIQQKTFPLVYENILRLLPDNLPKSIFSRLKADYNDNLKRNLSLSSFLSKVLRLLKDHNIEAIPFKGPVLAESIYGDIGRRFFSDLDILVRRSDAKSAWNILSENGLAPEIMVRDQLIEQYVDNEDNISFHSRVAGVTVELHWELSGNYLSSPLKFEGISEKMKTISFNKENLHVLSDEQLLVYLCIHGAKHEWEYLELICCVVELIKNNPNLDWRFIYNLADKWHCRNMLEFGLFLSWKLLDAPIPKRIEKKIIELNCPFSLGQATIQNMFRTHSDSEVKPAKSRFSTFHIKIRDSFPDKLRYITRLVFSPTKMEWALFDLPPYLFFLRYLFRPFRLISQSLKIIAEGSNA